MEDRSGCYEAVFTRSPMEQRWLFSQGATYSACLTGCYGSEKTAAA